MRMPRLVLLAVAVLPMGLPAQNTVSNSPPFVTIITPTNEAIFEAPVNIPVWANAIDRDGDVVEVSFFAALVIPPHFPQIYIGGVTNPPPTGSPLPPWRIVWENAPAGRYLLRARATDNRGAQAWNSDSVDIVVLPRPEPPLPLVNIVADHPEASEGTLNSLATSGSFQLRRSGSTAHPMTVFLEVSGTAENGIDYRSISNAVTIPAGASFIHVPVHPIDDRAIEPTETVVVRVEPIACPTIIPPPPGCYEVGSNHTATVFIRDAPAPPPTNRIVLTIEAADPVATEQDPRLDALTDSALLVVRRHGPTNVALEVQYRVGGSAGNGVDYERLSGVVRMAAGARTTEIEINAIDDTLVEGTETVIVTLQEPVCIAIFPPPPECYLVGQPDTATAYIRDNDSRPSNSPPSVRITSPSNGARFEAGGDIRIDAVTVDQDGYAPRAEFFANGRKIGEQEIHFIQAPPDGTPIEFSFVWNDVEAGSYTLTVKGTDDDGAMAFSAPVGIRVETNRPPPPPTNVVVSISAIDSYAVEGGGTNSTSRGTNTAAFLVRRGGPTNHPVTIRYHIGGTASNGVDYAALSGEVTMAAGARAARIPVVPLEDRLAEGIETVVLELARAGGEPPPYSIGQPSRAAAIIVDNDAPRPRCQRLAGGLFHICVPGRDGDYFRLEASCNLVDWVPLCTSIVSDGAIHFVDPDVEALPYRFYRSVPEAAPVEE